MAGGALRPDDVSGRDAEPSTGSIGTVSSNMILVSAPPSVRTRSPRWTATAISSMPSRYRAAQDRGGDSAATLSVRRSAPLGVDRPDPLGVDRSALVRTSYDAVHDRAP